MDDAITISLHTALNYIEHSGTHVRMLFVDYSSEFNTIIPDILIRKLSKKIFICPLSSLQEIANSRLLSKATKI